MLLIRRNIFSEGKKNKNRVELCELKRKCGVFFLKWDFLTSLFFSAHTSLVSHGLVLQ